MNIINNPAQEYNHLVQQGLSEAEALARCNAIVIHGDLFAREFAREQREASDYTNSKIIEWLKKPEVVFTRVTPGQKQTIVGMLQ